MNYATQYHIGDNQSTRTQATKAITPPTGRVRQLDAKTQRRKRSAKRQAKISSRSDVTNGFLTCTFLPKLRKTESIQACKKPKSLEKDFYTSLSQIADHYGITLLQTRDYDYPYNMALAISDMETKIKAATANWGNFQLIQDSKKTYITLEEKYDTGTTLYYIPVIPLFQMLHDPIRKRTAQLLISVCSYLYHIADIPYYRQQNSYLFWMYEMHRDWIEMDEETEDTEVYRREFLEAETIGDSIEQRIFNRINLERFEQRLDSFKCRDTFDRQCQKAAHNALKLFKEYPTTSIFRHAPTVEEDTDEYHNEAIQMDKYISFIAHTEGWLYDSLHDSINNEFNEYGIIDEPTVTKSFDGTDITTDSLDFENRLFALLDDLCTVLNSYKTSRI